MAILERVKRRLSVEEIPPSDDFLEELILTAKDRINLRIGVETFPTILESIGVDVVVKMYRKLYFEGIESESAESLSTSFVSDLLGEYNTELGEYKRKLEDDKEMAASKLVVKFL